MAHYRGSIPRRSILIAVSTSENLDIVWRCFAVTVRLTRSEPGEARELNQ